MSTAERVGEATAARIAIAMDRAGLVRQQVARRAGIPRETMARKLERTPEAFTIRELCDIADALEIRFEELAFGLSIDEAA